MARIVTMQDLSCVGQCSLTVALPILSACGVETCVLPSAVLSNHTAFSDFTFRDLTDDLSDILERWETLGFLFDALYTGYLGNARQIALVKALKERVLTEQAPVYIDPAMADNGKLYVGFDDAFVQAMKTLLPVADVLLPNITEACLLTETPYRESYDEAWIEALCRALCAQGAKAVVLTGVSYDASTTGVAVYENGHLDYYAHPRLNPGCHGTGDIYASAFVGAALHGNTLLEAARIAANFTLAAIEETHKDQTHWYGACFEKVLGKLIQALG